MLAALTGAVTASRLGIAGTIIGAAFMSLASTVGSAIYKHYLTRSNERLRAAAASLAPKASHSAVASAVARHHAQQDPIHPGPAWPGDRASWDRAALDQAALDQAALDQAARDQTQRYPVRQLGAPPAPAHGYVSPDGTETQIMPGPVPGRRLRLGPDPDVRLGPAAPAPDQHGPDQHGPADTVRNTVRGAPADLGGDVPTARLRAPADPGRPDQPGAAGPPPDAGHRWPWTRWPWTRRRWVIAAATALGVFVVAMGAVTVFEVLAGKPLDAVVWHQHSSGTTLGGLVGGSGGHHPRPGTSPSPSHSPGSSHSPRPSHTPSSTPSPTTSSPTPTPSGSPSPSSSATPSGNASSPPRRTRPRPPPRPRHRARPGADIRQRYSLTDVHDDGPVAS